MKIEFDLSFFHAKSQTLSLVDIRDLFVFIVFVSVGSSEASQNKKGEKNYVPGWRCGAVVLYAEHLRNWTTFMARRPQGDSDGWGFF